MHAAADERLKCVRREGPSRSPGSLGKLHLASHSSKPCMWVAVAAGKSSADQSTGYMQLGSILRQSGVSPAVAGIDGCVSLDAVRDEAAGNAGHLPAKPAYHACCTSYA